MGVDGQLDPELLETFAWNFFGYGNRHAANWLVSMEERGGENLLEVNARLAAWNHLDRDQICDVAAFHQHAHIGMQYFAEQPTLQNTWYKMIRIVLASQGVEPTPDNARLYQRDRLGRTLDETCLVPLLPLPAPSVNEWPYPEWTNLPQYQTRDQYIDHVINHRIQSIAALLEECQPANIVFLGAGHHQYANQILQVLDPNHAPFQQHELGFQFANVGNIQVIKMSSSKCERSNERIL